MRRLALALLCLSLAAPELRPRRRAAPGTVRGAVKVRRGRFFGMIAPSDDRSGVVVYVTGYEEPPPSERGDPGAAERALRAAHPADRRGPDR